MNNKAKILDIGMNLNRVGNLAADNYEKKTCPQCKAMRCRREKRINIFLEETKEYINSIDQNSLSKPFKKTFTKFLKEYSLLEKEKIEKQDDQLKWAETMMTWGNILTHRAKII
jgi:hypothetical protein